MNWNAPPTDEEENPEDFGFSVMNFGQTMPLNDDDDEEVDDKKKAKDDDDDSPLIKEDELSHDTSSISPLIGIPSSLNDPHDEIVNEDEIWDERKLLDQLERQQRYEEPPLGSDLGDEEE